MIEMMLAALLGGGFMQEPVLAQARVSQVALTVTDLAKAKTFYESTLGLPLAIETDAMLFFDCGGTMLMLALPEAEAPFSAAGAVVYFEVDALLERTEALRSRGVPFAGDPHVVHRANGRELWMAFFRDPDGHLLALTSWR